MKQALLILFALPMLTSVYDFTVNGMDDEEYLLNQYSGKEIAIAILPVTRTAADSLFLRTLDSISNSTDSIKVIAVPSYEDGFIDEQKDSLKLWYSSLLDSLTLVTVGMYTHKTSGDLQDPLFRWLTTEAENGRFNIDTKNTRQIFFVNGEGELHAVSMPAARIGLDDVSEIISE